MQNRIELDKSRMRFAAFMGNILRLNKPLIYMDETTFNTWQIKQQSWSHPDHRNEHIRPGPRHSTTVYAAIGLPLSKVVYKFGTSTNQVAFREFLRDVKQYQKSTVR